MGIEPKRSALESLENQAFGESPIAACDWRANFGVSSGNVGQLVTRPDPPLISVSHQLPGARAPASLKCSRHETDVGPLAADRWLVCLPIIKFCRESDSATLGLRLLHQTTNCVKDHLELTSYRFSSSNNLQAKSLCLNTESRNLAKARMISMFTGTRGHYQNR
jgi:hypothetical protein